MTKDDGCSVNSRKVCWLGTVRVPVWSGTGFAGCVKVGKESALATKQRERTLCICCDLPDVRLHAMSFGGDSNTGAVCKGVEGSISCRRHASY